MEFTITIIGAGVVGLAIAEELSAKYSHVLLLEKNAGFGQETSSRNSEVIHRGIHYPYSFFKSSFCIEGNRVLYEICRRRGIPHERLGKLIVAIGEGEGDRLAALKEQAERKGIDDLTLVGERQLRAMEPEVKAAAALFSPATGIIDGHGLMRSFLQRAEAAGAILSFRSEVTGIRCDGSAYDLEVNGGEYRLKTRVLINSAGLGADRTGSCSGYNCHKCHTAPILLWSKND